MRGVSGNDINQETIAQALQPTGVAVYVMILALIAFQCLALFGLVISLMQHQWIDALVSAVASSVLPWQVGRGVQQASRARRQEVYDAFEAQTRDHWPDAVIEWHTRYERTKRFPFRRRIEIVVVTSQQMQAQFAEKIVEDAS